MTAEKKKEFRGLLTLYEDYHNGKVTSKTLFQWIDNLVDEACKKTKIEECKYWQDAIFSPQSIIAQLSVVDFQLRITELESPSPKESEL